MDKKIIKMHNNPPNITKEVFTIITKIVNKKFKDIRKKNPERYLLISQKIFISLWFL